MAAPVAPVLKPNVGNLVRKSGIMKENGVESIDRTDEHKNHVQEEEIHKSLSEDEKKALLSRSKEEFSNRRRVVIENLPPNVSKENLEELLKGFEVKQIEIEGSKRKAQVSLESGDEASKVIKKFNNTVYRENKILVRMPPLEVICIMNLPLNFTHGEFDDLVNSFGIVHRCFLIYSENTGLSKGYGFVEYENTESALKARNELACKKLGNKLLHTDWAVPSLTTYSSLHSKCLLVEFLPKDTTDKDFREAVSQHAIPRFCKVAIGIKDETTFAVVEFDKSEDAETVHSSLQGREICGGKVTISFCTPGQTGHQIFSAMMARINGCHRKYLLPDPTPSALAQGNTSTTNNAKQSLLGPPPTLPFIPASQPGNQAATSMVTALVAPHLQNQFQQQPKEKVGKSHMMGAPLSVAASLNNPMTLLLAMQQQQQMQLQMQQQQMQQQVQQVPTAAGPTKKIPLLGTGPSNGTNGIGNQVNMAEKLILGNGNAAAAQLNSTPLSSNGLTLTATPTPPAPAAGAAAAPNVTYLQAVAQAQQNLINQLQQQQQKLNSSAAKPSLLGDPATAALVQTQAAYIAALTGAPQPQASTSPPVTSTSNGVMTTKPKTGLLGHVPPAVTTSLQSLPNQSPPQQHVQQQPQQHSPPAAVAAPQTQYDHQGSALDQYQQAYGEQLNQYLAQQMQNGYSITQAQAVDASQQAAAQYGVSHAAQQAYDYINKFMQKQSQSQAGVQTSTTMFASDPYQASAAAAAAAAAAATNTTYFPDPWTSPAYMPNPAETLLTSYSGPAYTPQIISTPVAGQKRSASHILPSPEPSPETGYVGQHSQGLGGHYADSYKRRKLV
ncbi:ribonucleoprotein PTB-binding 1-like isoform X2 [Ptychodera flava]|uniref:ribonucleoprotein PTB-binding 1-like isoform X2 n=1 Tax=Ptychodera flava TaxID=63121 RepID=UPI00396A4550